MKILTVSIAAYNVERFIKKALDSLIDENILDDIEVLIINDGSTDNTPKIVEEYEKRYPNTFKLINKINGGYGSTINTSMQIAQGKYYKLLDGDDWYCEENLVKFLNILKECESDLVITPNIEIVDGQEKGVTKNPLKECEEGKEFTFKEYPTGKRISMHQACFKTSAIQNKGIEIREHCFYTDAEYLLKSMSKCKTIVYYNIPVYIYRIGLDEQSMSVKGMQKHYQDAVRYFTEMIRYRKEENIDKAFYDKYLTDALTSLARYHLNMFFILDSSKKPEYVEFEQYIKENARDVYDGSRSRTLIVLRITRNLLYKPMCWWGKRKVKNAIRV